MRKILQPILLLCLLASCSDQPAKTATTETVSSIDTVNIFYINDTIHVSGGIIGDDPYPDTAIFFSPVGDPFSFEKDKRIINIYFDRQLKTLAVNVILDRKDKLEHYRRYDRKGTLRMEFIKKNGSMSNTDMAWHSNGKLKFKWSYRNGKHTTDTSYYFTGEVEEVRQYYLKVLKETGFYRNGKIASELFWEIPNEHEYIPRFRIHYDSLTGSPSLYYMVEKTINEKDSTGMEYSYVIAHPVPMDSMEVKEKKK